MLAFPGMRVAPPLEETARFRHFSCPECRGALEQLEEPRTGLVTFVCRVGHSYTDRELLVGKEIDVERTLWSSLATIDELIVVMGLLTEHGDPAAGSRPWRERLERAVRQRADLEGILARNEPVQLDHDLPIEPDPNSRLGR